MALFDGCGGIPGGVATVGTRCFPVGLGDGCAPADVLDVGSARRDRAGQQQGEERGDRKCEDERLPQFALVGRTHIAASPGADMFHEILEGAESLIPIDDFVSLANDND